MALRYESFDGTADLYTYFYEQGLKLLRPGGVLSYIVTNKWLRAGYGAPLRRFFTRNGRLEQLIDFGHAPIFRDADTFPCIVVFRAAEDNREASCPLESTAWVSRVPRERLKDLNLQQYALEHGYLVPRSRFSEEAWSLEPPAAEELMAKIGRSDRWLEEYIGGKPVRGVVTGNNDVFVINEDTRRSLIEQHPSAGELIRPCLRGQDVSRWLPDWNGQYLLMVLRGTHLASYPSIRTYLEKFRIELEPRPPGWTQERDGDWPGRKTGQYQWYELQDPFAAWETFLRPKIVYQEIQFHPAYGLDTLGMMTNNKAFILPTDDLYLLAVLNSPLMWWYNWRYLPHMKDEALSPVGEFMVHVPIANASPELRNTIVERVERLLTLAAADRSGHREWLDWLRLEHSVDKTGQLLENPAGFTEEQFIAELRQRRPKRAPFSPTAIQAVRAAYAAQVTSCQQRAVSRQMLETEISRLVCRCYALTPHEEALLWATAPPRMPLVAAPQNFVLD